MHRRFPSVIAIGVIAVGLSSCGSGNKAPTSPPTASELSVGFSTKQLQFSWTPATGAASYRLLESPDGMAGFAEVGSAAAPETNATLDITVYKENWAKARYALDACNAAGCTRSNEVTITQGMLAAIGYFKASNTGANDSFGDSVALSSDGNTLAVGAVLESSNATGIGGNQADNSAPFSGAVYVFTRAGGVWTQQAYVKASNSEANDFFGGSLALSSDGNTLAVSAGHESSNATGIGGNQADNSATDSGAVYVFVRAGGAWSQQAYVKASNTEAYDYFGGSLAFSSDGNTLAVGACHGPMSATPPGAVYVFARASGVWLQQAYVKASNTVADLFGYSVALSSDGNTLAVGVFRESSSATGIGGNQADNSAPYSGAVYMLARADGVWAQQAYVKASNTGANDGFGYSVALSSDANTLAVGARSEASNATGIGGNQADDSALQSGAVYLY